MSGPWTHIIHTCRACGASWHAPKDEPHECAVAAARVKALSDVFKALKAKEFGDLGPGGIWYVLPHLTTYGRVADFVAQHFGLNQSSEQRANAPENAPLEQEATS